jgi:hypothetical protein
MNHFVSDVRQAIRSLRASPGLVVTSVLSLGLGLGVNLTLFTAIGAVFFYEPTLADRDRVVAIQPGNSNQFSYLNYRDLRDSGVLESVAGYRRVPLTLRTGTAPEGVDGIAVTPNFFEFIGAPPALGRHFSAGEAIPERQPRVAVLSHPFWKRRFGGDPDVVGREVTINGEPFALIFYSSYLQQPRVSTQIRPVVVHVRTSGPPGALVKEVRDAIAAVDSTVVADVRTLREATGTEAAFRRFGTRLLASAGVLGLLLATIGLYGMMAFVVATRTSEIGVRMALGATAAQILGGVLAQGMRLVGTGLAIGAVVSLLLARAAVGLLAGLSAADPIAFGGAVALLMVVGLAACHVPARHAARVDPVVALRRM